MILLYHKQKISILFHFQGELVYAIIGDYPAPDFFAVNEKNGEITVTQDLKMDSLRSGIYVVSSLRGFKGQPGAHSL